MNSAAVLYTPEILALTTRLAQFPLDDGFALQATARSRSCGSQVTVGLELDASGLIARVGVRAQACAIGQAAAAIFALEAAGRNAEQIAETENGLRSWLRREAERPDWRGLEVLDAARAYPARHGAILLGW